MPVYHIRQSPVLQGEAQINVAKNAVLPILAASLLCSSPVTVRKVPKLKDIDSMAEVLKACGAQIQKEEDSLTIRAPALNNPIESAPFHKLRASVLVLGPLCARLHEADVPLPGGCAIGQRPVDIHLKGLKAMGVESHLENSRVISRGTPKSGYIYLDFPSVGATENLLMTAALTKGVTRIENAAKEPEIVDLADFLTLAGARIWGAGTGTIVIDGVEKLTGVEFTPIPDRIEAGTLACAAAVTDGSILLTGARSDHLRSLLHKLRETGMLILEDARGLHLRGRAKRAVDIHTLSYPGFPTDLQAPMMTVATQTKGQSIFMETIFENRYMHAVSLCRMGANIRTEGRMALIQGGAPLTGATVEATDLRAGAALMIAGLIAQGETYLVDKPGHISRGYDLLDQKLNAMGARISCETGRAPEARLTK
ncbi:MAG: UDP-N-acetylglucosamine 1-carboxyvinyltransferase [Clostridia bacterium]|nr:UDP-N-acetylglucosamine 1-carboxyvinyltransferase [Clostridia bacterium]